MPFCVVVGHQPDRAAGDGRALDSLEPAAELERREPPPAGADVVAQQRAAAEAVHRVRDAGPWRRPPRTSSRAGATIRRVAEREVTRVVAGHRLPSLGVVGLLERHVERSRPRRRRHRCGRSPAPPRSAGSPGRSSTRARGGRRTGPTPWCRKRSSRWGCGPGPGSGSRGASPASSASLVGLGAAPASVASAAMPTRSPNATPRTTDQRRLVAVAMRSVAFVCFSPRWGTEWIDVSTPAACASARSAPTVARSRGRRANGSNRKCRIALRCVMALMSSSGTPASERHRYSGDSGHVESECG